MNTANTYPNDTEWSRADVERAAEEGWGIFDADGSENGRTQLQALDEMAMCATDDDAWRFVAMKAAAGSELHRRALALIALHNPGEAKAIEALTGVAEA